jgi:prepilin-type N-terminal cleavage/methylation domain-containing protein
MQQSPYKSRRAFTLIEVLISIALMGIIIVALFSTVTMMRDSNAHLLTYLEKSKKITKATKVLYLDIASSDGNISIKRDEFVRLCMNETRNSLYGLSLAKVCWVVLKKRNTLVRIEGNNYRLPTRLEEKVEVNTVMIDMELFDVYHEKDKILVFLKQKGKEPISFMIQGVSKPLPKTIISGVLKGFPRGTKIIGQNIVLPNGKKYPVGSRVGKNGQIIPPPKRTRRTPTPSPTNGRKPSNPINNGEERTIPSNENGRDPAIGGPRYIPQPPPANSGQTPFPPGFEE